ncbi:MAG: helix-turn-helix transcriptional regulator [Oscillospiraceae bacterium]|nr:helix-turn-helix transcriptional regulator [Oscillospiraceae bacterium]
MLNFGNRLSNLRKQHHMTQQILSERLNVTKATVSSYETGIRLPSYDVLIKLSYIFHVSADYLLGIEEKSTLSVDGLTPGQIEIITSLISEFKNEK